MDKRFDYIDVYQTMRAMFAQERTVIERLVYLSRLKMGLSSVRRKDEYFSSHPDTAMKEWLAWLADVGYVVFRAALYTVAIRDSGEGCADTAVILYVDGSDTIIIRAYGAEQGVSAVMQQAQNIHTELATLIATAVGLSPRDSSVQTISKRVPNIGVRAARDLFYPWLNLPLSDYFRAFMESEESVLILFGPPGTGKSTFLRTLIHSGSYDTIMAYNKEVVESSELLTFFYRSKARILGYEDIDNYLRDREKGNTLMSNILNATEGVVRHSNKKIVFSTNLPNVDSIDPALLRVCRCFDILEFRALTSSEAANVLVDIGQAPRDFSSKPQWTLAEVLNPPNAARQMINRFGRKVGF